MSKIIRNIFIVAIVLMPLQAFALDMNETLESDGTMTTIRGGMIALCLAIAFITASVKSSLEGESIPVSHLALRLIFVVAALLAAGRIQGFLSGMGESIANSFLPGPSLLELHQTLQERVIKMQAESGSFNDINPITNTAGFFNFIAFQILLFFESGALTIYFFVFKWFKAMHHVVMMFLAAIAPFMITATIIPGVKGFTNWLKLIISVALWPVIASFFLKAHLMSAVSYLGGGENLVFSSDPNNFFLSMDSLQMLSEACLFGLFLIATPFIASAIVNGSAGVFSAGSVFLLGATPFALMRRSAHIIKGTGRATVNTGKFAYTVAPLVRHPTQAHKMVGNAIKAHLASSAKFKPAAAASPQGEGS